MNSSMTVSLVHPDSLGDTLDAVNAALFEKAPLPADARYEAAAWIADRQGLPGSYAGMFAPTGYDYSFGTLTFTGEPVRSGAATGHVLSEEACRAIFLLMDASSKPDQEVVGALQRARSAIFKRMDQSEAQGQWSGVYCCGTCSVALWRHLLASRDPQDVRRLENGLHELCRCRDGEGSWKRFPFYYTLLALIEFPLPSVKDELNYAGLAMERKLRRLSKVDRNELSKHDQRRRTVLEQALGLC